MNKNLNQYKPVRKLFVSKVLYNFVNKELLRKTKIKPKRFWHGLDRSLYQLRLKNEKLLNTRSNLQNLTIFIVGLKPFKPVIELIT